MHSVLQLACSSRPLPPLCLFFSSYSVLPARAGSLDFSCREQFSTSLSFAPSYSLLMACPISSQPSSPFFSAWHAFPSPPSPRCLLLFSATVFCLPSPLLLLSRPTVFLSFFACLARHPSSFFCFWCTRLPASAAACFPPFPRDPSFFIFSWSRLFSVFQSNCRISTSSLNLNRLTGLLFPHERPSRRPVSATAQDPFGSPSGYCLPCFLPAPPGFCRALSEPFCLPCMLFPLLMLSVEACSPASAFTRAIATARHRDSFSSPVPDLVLPARYAASTCTTRSRTADTLCPSLVFCAAPSAYPGGVSRGLIFISYAQLLARTCITHPACVAPHALPFFSSFLSQVGAHRMPRLLAAAPDTSRA